jgi:hypothetical protein
METRSLTQIRMRIEKCDLCIREIGDGEREVSVSSSPSYRSFTFCGECGEPVLKFLYKNKLMRKGEKSAWEELKDGFGAEKKPKKENKSKIVSSRKSKK